MSEKVSMLGVPNNTVDENGIRWRRTRCFMCHMNCGVWCGVDTKTGRLVEMRPNEEEGSVLCNRLGEKGEKAIKFHYHPKRINHCMKRVGEKGEDRWEEISWEQAISEISEKLLALKEKYGAKTLFSSEGTYRSDHLWARTRFFNLFGNPGNVVDPGTICWCWNYSLNMAMVGWPVEAIMPVSPSYTGTIVNWGKRWSEAYAPEGPLWRTMRGRIDVNQDNPAQYINIDTTCIDGSATADIWLQPYPGTDCAISFAWLNVIFEEKLWDDDFVRYWSNAPFLVRKDTGKLVRLDEFNGGKHEDFLVMNESTGELVTWCSDENRYYEDCEVTPVLQGTFKIKMADGSEVECWTAFDAIEDRFKDWTPERASKISNVPARKIREAARLYATNGPAFIGWGLGGGDQHGINASQFGIAKTMARILTGNIDNPGGEYVGQPADPDDKEKLFPVRDSELELADVLTPEIQKDYIGNEQFRVMSWPGFKAIDKCYRKMFGLNRPMMHQMLCSPSLMWKAILEKDPMGRVACETTACTGMIHVMGEITTSCYVDIAKIAREVVRDIGYDRGKYGFDCDTCAVITSIDEQSPDIALGVDKSLESKESGDDELSNGAGDQGMMFGYACDETPELMPLAISLAHKMAKRLTQVRKEGMVDYLRPDGKTQVTVEYDENNRPVRVDTVVISTQHNPDVPLEQIRRDMIEQVAKVVIPADMLDENTKYYVNPTGRFVKGGPAADSG
ncbi:MAG: S-adenosylmethionine synthetase N-terminal domain-containing protein, partial [Coriobacteriaceae bacterium]|nr:S-adenosylmethionine synthetase N-terminal domain-containing protein [Coriobacteriaceae bacterium]